MTSNEPAHLVTRYFEMWNTGDPSIAEEILSPDWVDHAHPEVSAPSAVAQAIDRIRATQPDLRFQIDAILSNGSLVAAVGSVSREPTNVDPRTSIIWLVQTRGGRMTEMWTYRAQPPATQHTARP